MPLPVYLVVHFFFVVSKGEHPLILTTEISPQPRHYPLLSTAPLQCSWGHSVRESKYGIAYNRCMKESSSGHLEEARPVSRLTNPLGTMVRTPIILILSKDGKC
ncbi:unnamed protein product [Arctia plantaginis]|uniref:Uncharacterized protein n=1 Tax=Arctia plantaginis TaxID=874455 RepID=A0A8S1B7B7_ARCPL|nr:unnamed protein product [Arctia plantaginis]